jgi:hypothetical protein
MQTTVTSPVSRLRNQGLTVDRLIAVAQDIRNAQPGAGYVSGDLLIYTCAGEFRRRAAAWNTYPAPEFPAFMISPVCGGPPLSILDIYRVFRDAARWLHLR